jgi:glycosyltransferase involved in cell wall biosynthesis
MRILFLSRWYPYPPDNGSKIRVSGLLRALCARHNVTLISFCPRAEEAADPSPSGAVPSEIHVCPYREFEPATLRARLGYLSSRPRFLVDTHSPEMERLIRQVVDRGRFDLVIASQLSMAAYYQSFQGIPAIFEEAELGIYWPEGSQPGSSWSRTRRALTLAKHRRFIARLLEHFVCCTVVSDVERQLLAAAAPRYQSVHVVPNSVDAQPLGHGGLGRVPDSLIFTGSLRYAPNRDAMTWFVNEVFPAVRAGIPGACLTITGETGPDPPAPVPNVVLAGRVPEVRSLLASAAVSLAPIRLGGGTRLKILEAMAVRTPVVATTKAVEGLDVRHGEHVMIADTPRAFANAVLDLLRDSTLAREMADRAWHLWHARYDSQVVIPQFLSLVEQTTAA